MNLHRVLNTISHRGSLCRQPTIVRNTSFGDGRVVEVIGIDFRCQVHGNAYEIRIYYIVVPYAFDTKKHACIVCCIKYCDLCCFRESHFSKTVQVGSPVNRAGSRKRTTCPNKEGMALDEFADV